MKVTFAAVVITALATVSAASELPDYPFVFSKAEATTGLEPDIGTVDYEVGVRNEKSEEAMKLVESRSAETLKTLFDNGVKPDDITGFNVEKDIIRDYESRDKILGYEVTRRIRFVLRDLKKFEPIISSLLNADSVVNVKSSFDRTDKDKIESRLLAQAIAKARSKAEMIAKESHQRIVKLRAISQLGFRNIGAEFGLTTDSVKWTAYEFSASENEKLLFVPSTINFSNSVSVIYELDEEAEEK